MKNLLTTAIITFLTVFMHLPGAAANDLQTEYVCIQTHTANIRNGPGTSHAVINQIRGVKANEGTHPLLVKQNQGHWLQVVLPDGEGDGWISESLTKLAIRVMTDDAPVNIFPAEDIIDVLPLGTPLCVDGHNGAWHRIRVAGKTSYIDSRLTSRFAASDYGGNFVSAILDCNKNKVEKLLDEGTDPANYSNGTGFWRGVAHTPLYWALWAGCFDVADILVKAGAPPNLGGWGHNLLYHAALNIRKQQIHWLLSHGVDVNTVESIENNTPLMAAAGYATTEIVELFLSKGAYVNATNEHGSTALMKAAGWSYEDWGQISKNQTEVVKLLIANGADVFARDSRGLTAIDYAIKNKHEGIIRILRDASKLRSSKSEQN